MILNNFKKLASVILSRNQDGAHGMPFYAAYDAGSALNYFYYSSSYGTTRLDPNVTGGYSVYLGTLMTALENGLGAGGVVFGSGTTAVTANDYKLSGSLVSTLSLLSTNKEKVYEDNCFGIKYKYTLQNSGSASVTIGEVGWIAVVNDSNSNDNQWRRRHPLLIERTVLDSAITLEPSDIAVVNYTIKIPFA